MKRPASLLLSALLLVLGACDSPGDDAPGPQTKVPPAQTRQPQAPDEEPPTQARQAPASDEEPPAPPTPPVQEDFEGRPQLSLFPRVAGFRPEDDNGEGMAYWRTFIEHVVKTSGIAAADEDGAGRAWAIRGIDGLDSVAFFSPLAVRPETTYRVEFAFRGELPEGGEAGIGVLEFDEFLWIGNQFTESQLDAHLTGSHPGVRLDQGRQAWQRHSFTFTTSPAAGMIHLILFREGEQARERVLFDDISIVAADPAAASAPKEEP